MLTMYNWMTVHGNLGLRKKVVLISKFFSKFLTCVCFAFARRIESTQIEFPMRSKKSNQDCHNSDLRYGVLTT